MFFFIRERETLLGDVSTDVVKSKSRVDSRNLHCRTSSKDSMSEIARERKDRAQRERSPVMTFGRKLSFIMRMRALMDGYWRAIRAMLLAVYFGRRRIRFASSAWKLSSLASKLLSRIHDSAP